MNQRIDLTSLDADHNLAARETAQSRISWPVNLTPESVTYSSDGHLLIIADELSGRHAARELNNQGLASITLLVIAAASADSPGHSDSSTGSENPLEEEAGVESLLEDTGLLSVHYAHDWQLEGYLGQFTLTLPYEDGGINLAQASIGRPHFDLVLDLAEHPTLTLELLPPGYTAASWGTEECQQAISDLPQQVGEFAKPRYFQINHNICAMIATARQDAPGV